MERQAFPDGVATSLFPARVAVSPDGTRVTIVRDLRPEKEGWGWEAGAWERLPACISRGE